MNAAPELQLQLLDLQDIDLAVDRLAQRRRTLPEIAELERLDARLDELRDAIVGAETELTDISRAERKLEDDIDVVRNRMTKDRERLDAGAVSSPRELENLQHEIASLARRQSELEDLELEQMELREGIEGRLKGLTAERDDVMVARDDATQRQDTAFAEIDRELAERRANRDSLAAEITAVAGPLVELYEKIRASSGGQGAAALHRGQCQGCHLTMSPSDLDHFRTAPPDEVLRCEECRRILIRRPDSGL